MDLKEAVKVGMAAEKETREHLEAAVAAINSRNTIDLIRALKAALVSAKTYASAVRRVRAWCAFLGITKENVEEWKAAGKEAESGRE